MTSIDRAAKAFLLAVAVAAASGCATTETAKQPEAPAAAAEQPAPTPTAAAMEKYSVVRGDCLWNIAAKPKIYGNPYEWPLIYKTNSAQIKDPDLIFPGQVFDIDHSFSKEDIDRAVYHAKHRGAWSLRHAEPSDLAYLQGK